MRASWEPLLEKLGDYGQELLDAVAWRDVRGKFYDGERELVLYAPTTDVSPTWVSARYNKETGEMAVVHVPETARVQTCEEDLQHGKVAARVGLTQRKIAKVTRGR